MVALEDVMEVEDDRPEPGLGAAGGQRSAGRSHLASASPGSPSADDYLSGLISSPGTALAQQWGIDELQQETRGLILGADNPPGLGGRDVEEGLLLDDRWSEFGPVDMVALGDSTAGALAQTTATLLTQMLQRCQHATGELALLDASSAIGQIAKREATRRAAELCGRGIDTGWHGVNTAPVCFENREIVGLVSNRLGALSAAEQKLGPWAARDADFQRALAKACPPHLQSAVHAELHARKAWLRGAGSASGIVAALAEAFLQVARPLDEEGAPAALCTACLEARDALKVAQEAVLNAAAVQVAAEERLQECEGRLECQAAAYSALQRGLPELGRHVVAALRRLPELAAAWERVVGGAVGHQQEEDKTLTSSGVGQPAAIRADNALRLAGHVMVLLDGVVRGGVSVEAPATLAEEALDVRRHAARLATLARVPSLVQRDLEPELRRLLTLVNGFKKKAGIDVDSLIRHLTGPGLRQFKSAVAAWEHDGEETEDAGQGRGSSSMRLFETALHVATAYVGSTDTVAALSLAHGGSPSDMEADVVAIVRGGALPRLFDSGRASSCADGDGPAPQSGPRRSVSLFPDPVLDPKRRQAIVKGVLEQVSGRLQDDAPVRTQIRGLIREATDPQALASMFEGWMAWV